ncbi:MAG: S9 family peptidase [bacterium]|nr:S9 family peptidase [Gammaproteobacteria bacterium]HIL96324.1 S9 family peptidase [Pseudomonadales bacterium]
MRHLISSLCILALIVINLVAPRSAQADIIQDLAKNAEILLAKISPKGDYIGVLRESDGKRSVAIFTFPAMKFSSLLSYPGRDEVGNFWWVNDERILADVARNYDRWEEARATGELFAMNANGKKREHLFGLRAGADQSRGRTQNINNEYASAFLMDRLPSHPKYVLVEIVKWSRGLGNPVEAAWLNIYSGRQSKRIRAPAANAQLLADANGEIRFSFYTDSNQNLVVHLRNSKEGRWEEFSSTSYGDAQTTPLATLEDGRILVSHSPDEGPYGIYVMDPQDGSIKLVYRHEYVDAAIVQDRDGVPYGVHTMPGRIEFTPIDPDHPRSMAVQALEGVFPDGSVQITSSTQDNRLMIAAVLQDNKTPEFFLFNAEKNQLQSLFDSSPWIDDLKLARMEPIKVTARDGLVLHGYLTLPNGSQGKNEPLIIVPHGGPHGERDKWGFQWFEGFIPASGYAMLQINYRGSGGYGPGFERMGHREWANKMQDDLTDSVNWAIQEGIADPNRICIFGWSYGGFATVMSIAIEPELYQCAVAGAGVYDQQIQYTEADFTTRTLWGKKYIDKVIGPSKEDRRLASPTNYVANIKTPLLLIHGEEDERVPIEHAKALQKAMVAAGKPEPRLLELKNELHTPRNEENKVIMFRETLAFFEAYIGKPGAGVEKKR